MAALIFLFIVLIAALVALAFAVNTLISVFRYLVPYVSTSDWAIQWLVDNLKRKDDAVVYDLGCGDARVLKAIKERHPSIKAIGYEKAWWPLLLAKWRNRKSGVIIRNADFYKADLKDANVIFCFLIQAVMTDVENLLRRELRPEARVYSYGFRFPTLRRVDEIINPKRPEGSRLLVYRV